MSLQEGAASRFGARWRIGRGRLKAAAGVATVGFVLAWALPASADSTSLYIDSDCQGGGYSYDYPPPNAGTYNLYTNSGCIRMLARSWRVSGGAWQDHSWVQDGANIHYDNYSALDARAKHRLIEGFSGTGTPSTCSLGPGNCGTW